MILHAVAISVNAGLHSYRVHELANFLAMFRYFLALRHLNYQIKASLDLI